MFTPKVSVKICTKGWEGNVVANGRGLITRGLMSARELGKDVDQSGPWGSRSKEKVSRSVDGLGVVGKQECLAGYPIFYTRSYIHSKEYRRNSCFMAPRAFTMLLSLILAATKYLGSPH